MPWRSVSDPPGQGMVARVAAAKRRHAGRVLGTLWVRTSLEAVTSGRTASPPGEPFPGFSSEAGTSLGFHLREPRTRRGASATSRFSSRSQDLTVLSASSSFSVTALSARNASA